MNALNPLCIAGRFGVADDDLERNLIVAEIQRRLEFFERAEKPP